MNIEVSPIITFQEVLARGIVHPLMYSKSAGQLKENAFKPPPGRNDVSVLRLLYAGAGFCKKHFKSLVVGFHAYCGMALIKAGDVEDIPSKVADQSLGEELPKVRVAFTPLDDKGQLRTDAPVFSADAGLPMHADIVFDFIPEPESPAPLWVRKIAKALAHQPPAMFFEDPDPESGNWTGAMLVLPS
ncbi:MAG: hypothetical protein EPO28_11205 [Saprospiraceae bacterium]|nr:MAG: hypothetical protein EPO28_11205 [Saprospiraceae bacterium]